MKKLLPMLFLVLLQSLLLSCSDSDGGGSGPTDTGELANFNVVSENVGATEAVPAGDGSGMVHFTATADHSVGYMFQFPDGTEFYSADGTEDWQFRETGTHTYNVTVKALGANNSSLSRNLSVTVNFEPQLDWADEFDVDGAPNNQIWSRETGGSGWGNNESQYYTDSNNNSFVSGGLLHIVLKKEPYQGMQYTSARLITAGKKQFTYGRMEIRAKLPTGGGTWPAIWMLGSNYGSAGWPGCGEIDIMEQVGNNPGHVLGTLHHPGHSGANGSSGSTTVADCSTAFHTYKADWSPTAIKFYVDDTLFYTFTNSTEVPFNHDFFMLLNVAMGGNFGGAIDPNFTESEMLVDYVRVYR